MNSLEVILLATLQGLTEFLPISSSGHLVLLESILRFEEEQIFFFNISVHVATLMATLLFYRKEIIDLISNFFKEIFSSTSTEKSTKPFTRFLIMAIVTSLITAVIGLLLKKVVMGFYKDYYALAILFMLNALLLYSSKSIYRKSSSVSSSSSLGMLEITLSIAILVGIAQGIAVLPGISRSGSTIIVALLLGMKNQDAMKYSFLVSIPAILGAFVLEIVEMSRQTQWLNSLAENRGHYLTAFLISFSIGYACLYGLLSLIKKRKLYLFSYYLFLPIVVSLGIAVLR